MKIRLLVDVPVEEKHGIVKGKVFEVVDWPQTAHVSYWVMGDAGERVGLKRHEVEVIANGQAEGKA